MRKLAFRPDAMKDLRELQLKPFRQVATKILDLLTNPEPNDSSELKGYPYRRFDSGEFRVIYQVEPDTVTIIVVGKRNDDEVYRVLKRL